MKQPRSHTSFEGLFFKYLFFLANQKQDKVFIPGDLPTDSSLVELSLAKTVVKQLQDLKLEPDVIPGNHDVHTKKADREKRGLTDGLVRISVGIEHIDDIIDDLDHALEIV